jgi:rhodanese-related sulfurtransferase
MMLYDALAANFSEVAFARDPSCPCCGPNHDKEYLKKAYEVDACEGGELMSVATMTPVELKAALVGPNPPVILDVRETFELEISRLDGVVHIPMGELVGRLAELDQEAPVVVICRSGQRSMNVAAYLQEQGFNVWNLTGGINAWAQTVDPRLPIY